ncbi:DUF6011 domain-containing protein [Mycobacterium sp. 23]|uniref:DUF6011 domain-containing protein n=1 Tax=Mycobacterium sp. 23 TaxID=3400424 RepID=UPI003AAA2D65
MKRSNVIDRTRCAEDAILAAAAELGYRLAIPCERCNRSLTHPESVAARRGPHCRRSS